MEHENVKSESGSSAVGVPSFRDRRPSPDGKTRVVRFVVPPATMLQLVLAVACLWLLIRLWPVFLVLVAALLIVGTMSPAVTWMESRGVKRWLGIAIVFMIFFGFATLAAILTLPSLVAQASALVEQEPAFRARLVQYFDRSNLTAPLADCLRQFKYNTPAIAVEMSDDRKTEESQPAGGHAVRPGREGPASAGRLQFSGDDPSGNVLKVGADST